MKNMKSAKVVCDQFYLYGGFVYKTTACVIVV
jgi:hypothetical protein